MSPEDLSDRSHWSDLAGIDALTVFVGSSISEPDSILTVTSLGSMREWVGSAADIEPPIVALAADGGWTARVKIPIAWITNNYLEMGYIRSSPGLASVYCSPYPCLPWRMDPGRYRFDLRAWDPTPANIVADEP